MLRHKFAVAGFFIGVLALVATATVLMPRTYRSQTKLFLRLGRENATLDPTATLGQNPVVALPATRESEINSILEILKSRVLLERVVDRVGPEVILGKAPYEESASIAEAPVAPSRVVDDRYRAVVALAQKIEVEAVKKSNVIQIAYEGPSPDASQAVVRNLVEFYLEEHARINRTPGAHKFLTEQTERVRADLSTAENALRALKDETGLIAPDGQRTILVDRIGRLETELSGLTATALATEAEAKSFREKVAALTPTVVIGTTRGLPNQAADTMRAQLYALQIRELELKAKYPENHPELILTRQQTSAAASLLAKEEIAREQVTTGPIRHVKKPNSQSSGMKRRWHRSACVAPKSRSNSATNANGSKPSRPMRSESPSCSAKWNCTTPSTGASQTTSNVPKSTAHSRAKKSPT